jgi:RNA-directed DNA polymerase
MQQKNQKELASVRESRGEAPMAMTGGTEVSATLGANESPSEHARLMEDICLAENVKKAMRKVIANKGSAGVDGMTVDELPEYLKRHWLSIRLELLEGRYEPQPVKRVEIPKPMGGIRKLGIPTVKDRFIQQAVLQILQPEWDRTFSEYSYGFRPGRSARQAVAKAQEHIWQGYGWVVDIDLEKFFDKVNHDMLMGRVAKRVKDRRVVKLIRSYLNSGVLEDGLVKTVEEGTPQGGPLSPLLSNLFLDELDRELEKRGHRFVRYADDSNIYVRSQRAGERVMASITKFITKKLKLKVNESKSAVARPQDRKLLGFSFTWGRVPRRRLAPQTVVRFKAKVRRLTLRRKGFSFGTVEPLKRYLRGWIGYFGYCQTPTVVGRLEEWMRRRLRATIWKQWKQGRTRFAELRKRGIGKDLAAQTAGSAHGSWRIGWSPAMQMAFPKAYFTSLGIPDLAGCVSA